MNYRIAIIIEIQRNTCIVSILLKYIIQTQFKILEQKQNTQSTYFIHSDTFERMNWIEIYRN